LSRTTNEGRDAIEIFNQTRFFLFHQQIAEKNRFAQKVSGFAGLMCGKPLAFRRASHLDSGYTQLLGAEPQVHCGPERKRRALPHVRRQSRRRESFLRQITEKNKLRKIKHTKN
jgi:hypothetical protein